MNETLESRISSEILVVDDELHVRRLLIDALKAANYSAREASDGKEALDMISEGYIPDIVVTDLKMPVMGGMSLLKKTMEMNGTKGYDMKVIIMTAHGDEATAEEAVLSGASFYMAKPFNLPLLLKKVEKALAAQREEREDRMYAWMLAQSTPHNINNALTPCMGLELMKGYKEGTVFSEGDAGCIASSWTGIQRVVTFNGDLLSMSRGVEYSTFNLGDLIQGIVAEEKEKDYVRVKWEFKGQPAPIIVDADWQKLAAVVRNMALDVTYNAPNTILSVNVYEENGLAVVRFGYHIEGKSTLYGVNTSSGLPLARTFARQHKGQYRLITGENCNESVEIKIPLKSPQL